jgi:hypothetical protein
MNTTDPASDVPLDDSPAHRIAVAVERFGEKNVAERAASLLRGGNEGEQFLLWVGGRHAQGVLDGAPPLYWPEVWGARALNYVWDESCESAVIAGLSDRAWRVREMCARVCLGRKLGTSQSLSPLLSDENERVRIAGARAIAEVGEADDAPALTAMLRDPEKEVRRAAQQSLVRLAKRLDRPLD